MRTVLLVRAPSTPDGVFGELVTDRGFRCATLERPDLGNQQNISCIPAGIYECCWRTSEKHGACYRLINVPGRTDVEIHSANVMQQLLGCIALGADQVKFNSGALLGSIALDRDQFGISSSRQTVAAFNKLFIDSEGNQAPFKLTIQGG